MAAGFRPGGVIGVPVALGFMALIAILFTALGTAVASALEDFQGFQLVMNFLVMPIFFLSGALFPLVGLPKALSVIASVDPLSYGVDGLRATLIGLSHFGAATDVAVLTALSMALLVIGGYFQFGSAVAIEREESPRHGITRIPDAEAGRAIWRLS
jgi:ABC-2 type transport system permease protein